MDGDFWDIVTRKMAVQTAAVTGLGYTKTEKEYVKNAAGIWTETPMILMRTIGFNVFPHP